MAERKEEDITNKEKVKSVGMEVGMGTVKTLLDLEQRMGVRTAEDSLWTLENMKFGLDMAGNRSCFKTMVCRSLCNYSYELD